MPRKNKREIKIDESDPDFDLVKSLGNNQIYNEVQKAEKPRPEFHIRAGWPGQIVQFDLLDVTPLADRKSVV